MKAVVDQYADWIVVCDHLGTDEKVCPYCHQEVSRGIYDPYSTLPDWFKLGQDSPG